MKTYSAKPTEVVRLWYVIDASKEPFGRISTKVASLLMGKGKPMFTKHIDCGDFVIVINAANIVATGKKMDDKTYYRHTQHPGGIKKTALKDLLSDKPESVIEKAVYGMLPVNKLRDGRMKRLKVYAGAEHNHAAQNPQIYNQKESK